MLVGYARVSRGDAQDVGAQVEALRAAGCRRVYREEASGGRWDRPGLQRLLGRLRPGDTLVVWKLDRVSRSLKDLLAILERVRGAGAAFRSLTESVETESPAGRMLAHMLGAFAEFERAMIRERTLRGLEYARSLGRTGGRRPKLRDEERREALRAVLGGEESQAEAARRCGVHRSTVCRWVAGRGRRDRGGGAEGAGRNPRKNGC